MNQNSTSLSYFCDQTKPHDGLVSSWKHMGVCVCAPRWQTARGLSFLQPRGRFVARARGDCVWGTDPPWFEVLFMGVTHTKRTTDQPTHQTHMHIMLWFRNENYRFIVLNCHGMGSGAHCSDYVLGRERTGSTFWTPRGRSDECYGIINVQSVDWRQMAKNRRWSSFELVDKTYVDRGFPSWVSTTSAKISNFEM